MAASSPAVYPRVFKTEAVKVPGRLEWLDSIRGIAACIVLLGHLAGAFDGPPLEKKLFSWCDGRVAVTMFFVLSGFVLARPYIGRAVTEQPRKLLWINFYVRRITRIWLPWLAVFWLSMGALKFVPRNFSIQPPFTQWGSSFWNTPLDAMAILKQHFYALHDANRLLLPQDWSLGTELKGSFLIPFLLLLFRRSSLLVVALAIGYVLVRPTGYYVLTFAAGVLLAGFNANVTSIVQRLSTGAKVGLLALALILIETRTILGVENYSDRFLWCSGLVGCCLFLALALENGWLQKTLSSRSLVFLGRVSYSLYLIQFVVILAVLPLFIAGLNAIGLHSTALLFPLVIILGTSITVAISELLYRIVEQPSIELGHRLGKRIRF